METKLNMLEPRETEKSYLEQTNRTYVFEMDLNDSKQEIARKIEKEFNVTVTDVRTLTRKGKKTKFSKGKHAYPGTTFRRNRKYAYVKLKKGDFIKAFEGVEDNNKSSAKEADEKTAKAAAKAEAKAEKAAKKAEKSADKNAAKEKK